MKRINRNDSKLFSLDKNVKPALIVEQEEEFIVETQDALDGCIRTDEDLPVPWVIGRLAGNPLYSNPVTGPIFVQGAEPGDSLLIEIRRIIPDIQGFTCIVPGIGPLKDSSKWDSCKAPYTRIIKHLPGKSGTTEDGIGVFSDKISWPLKPFIGTIATAPEREVHASVVAQGAWGGNLDVRDICQGSNLILPVFNKGGLLFLGDVHGTQADSEFYGVADETSAEVYLRCQVIKRKTVPFARVEKNDSLIQLNSYRPLEEAITQAILWLMEWLVTEYKIDPREAYMQMSVNPDVRINVYQMVAIDRLQYTVGIQFPKRDLP